MKLRGMSRCHRGQWEEKSDQLSRFESGKVSEHGRFQVEKLHKHEDFFFLSLYKGWLFCHPLSSEKWEGLGEMVIKMYLCGSGRPLSYCYTGLSLLEA